MKYKILGLMILISVNSFSQNDSLFKAISEYEDKTGMLITNGRKLLLSDFLNNDINKVSEVDNFLKKTENKDYIALYPFERWMLDYWTGNFGDILQTTLQFDSSYYASFNYRIKPPYDLLERKVYDATKLNRSSLIHKIDSSKFENDKKDFLKLNLDYTLIYLEKKNGYQDTLNKVANDYLKKYPQSDYTRIYKDIYSFSVCAIKLSIYYGCWIWRIF